MDDITMIPARAGSWREWINMTRGVDGNVFVTRHTYHVTRPTYAFWSGATMSSAQPCYWQTDVIGVCSLHLSISASVCNHAERSYSLALAWWHLSAVHICIKCIFEHLTSPHDDIVWTNTPELTIIETMCLDVMHKYAQIYTHMLTNLSVCCCIHVFAPRYESATLSTSRRGTNGRQHAYQTTHTL
jgi:hypothetical protein